MNNIIFSRFYTSICVWGGVCVCVCPLKWDFVSLLHLENQLLVFSNSVSLPIFFIEFQHFNILLDDLS